ncbi:MAG: hypothetical protein CMC13_07005 [Flavobacteriaceae bacterium]|nr:hypothetical protein [Flavobacteriaceae bacterium]
MNTLLVLTKNEQLLYQLQGLSKQYEVFTGAAISLICTGYIVPKTTNHVTLVCIDLESWDNTSARILPSLEKLATSIPLFGLTLGTIGIPTPLHPILSGVICTPTDLFPIFHKRAFHTSPTIRFEDGIVPIVSKKERYFLRTSEIVYLQADDHSVDMYLTDGTAIPIFNTLRHFEQSLPKPFYRVQRSYMVNAYHVKRIQYIKKRLYVRNLATILPFSKTYEPNLQHIEEWLRTYTV